jgi:N-acetylmuramoyl-L-alanine amidase
VAPQTIDGAVMVPVRFVAQYLGGTVEWKPATRVVRITRGTQTLVMIVGTTRGSVNNEGRALAAPPVIVRGRTLIPLRDVARFFGAQVQHNPGLGTVFVTVPNAPAGGTSRGGGAPR